MVFWILSMPTLRAEPMTSFRLPWRDPGRFRPAVEGRIGQHLLERAFQFPHVGTQMFGDEEGDFVVELDAFGFGLFLRDGDPHFQFRRLDLDGQAPVEAGHQAVVETVDVLGVGIAGDDDLLLASTRALKRKKNSSWERFLPLKNWTSSRRSTSRER